MCIRDSHQDIQLGVTPDEAWAADVLPDTVVPMVHGLTEQGADRDRSRRCRVR